MSQNPEPPVDESTWRNRFILVNVTRIAATIMVLLGLLIWQSDTIVTGGSLLGIPMILFGLVASFGAPRWLARKWRTPPPQ